MIYQRMANQEKRSDTAEGSSTGLEYWSELEFQVPRPAIISLKTGQMGTTPHIRSYLITGMKYQYSGMEYQHSVTCTTKPFNC